MARDLSPTGIEALDTFLGGGLPHGFTTLLLAPSGAGAEIFAKQFACGGRQKAVYATTDESEEEVLDTVAGAGWDFGNVDVLDLQSIFAEQMLDAQQQDQRAPAEPAPQKRRKFDPRDLVEGTSSTDFLRRGGTTPPREPAAQEPTEYLTMLLDPFSKLRRPDRMVVHSLDFFLNLYPIERVVQALTALKAANAKSRGQLLWVLSKGAHGATTERRLELLADCLIELEMTRKGTTFERFCLVKKVKNRAHGIGVSTYEVGADGFHLETLERIV